VEKVRIGHGFEEELGQIDKLVRQVLGSNGGSKYTTSQGREL
jgi:hypothetical protein